MKVQYLGNNNGILRCNEEYDIDYVCGNKGGYVIVGDSHQILYDSVVDLALDWNILGDMFIKRDEAEEKMKLMARLP